MSEFQTIMLKCWSFLKLPMNIYGYTFSYWDAAVWTMVLSAIIVLMFSWQREATKKGK